MKMLAVILVTVLATAPSNATEILVPLHRCPPPVEGAEECLVGGLAWYGPRSAKPIQIRPGAKIVRKRFLVSGELNGSKSKRYALEFVQPSTDYFAYTDRSGPVAYQTRSTGESHLVILTQRGPLRVLTKNVGLEPPPNIVVIDERRWRVVARYYHECMDLSALKSLRNIWDEGRKHCVSLRASNIGVLSKNSCVKPKVRSCHNAPPLPADFHPARGTTIEKLDAAVRDIRTLHLSPNNTDGTYFGGNGWGVRAYRVAHTPYLVLIGGCGDCDE